MENCNIDVMCYYPNNTAVQSAKKAIICAFLALYLHFVSAVCYLGYCVFSGAYFSNNWIILDKQIYEYNEFFS